MAVGFQAYKQGCAKSAHTTFRWKNAPDSHYGKGSSQLSLANAKIFNNYFKQKYGIVQIDNKDRLCLPCVIVVG